MITPGRKKSEWSQWLPTPVILQDYRICNLSGFITSLSMECKSDFCAKDTRWLLTTTIKASQNSHSDHWRLYKQKPSNQHANRCCTTYGWRKFLQNELFTSVSLYTIYQVASKSEISFQHCKQLKLRITVWPKACPSRSSFAFSLGIVCWCYRQSWKWHGTTNH